MSKSKCEKTPNEANLGPNNLWKAARIAQEKSQSTYPKEMQDSSLIKKKRMQKHS